MERTAYLAIGGLRGRPTAGCDVAPRGHHGPATWPARTSSGSPAPAATAGHLPGLLDVGAYFRPEFLRVAAAQVDLIGLAVNLESQDSLASEASRSSIRWT